MSENKIPAGAKDGAETIGPEDLEKFKNRFREEMESFLSGYEDKNKPRILVAGSTGCGKSTLCNLVFKRKVCTEGAGTPVTRGVRKITRPEIPVIVYDSEGYETGARFSDRSDGEESAGQKYCDLIMNAVEKERIDLVWYCISAPGSRVTDVDISLIKQFRSLKKPVAVVLTQIDVATEEDCEELKKTIAGEVDGPNPEEGRKIAIFESTNDSGITVPEGCPEVGFRCRHGRRGNGILAGALLGRRGDHPDSAGPVRQNPGSLEHGGFCKDPGYRHCRSHDAAYRKIPGREPYQTDSRSRIGHRRDHQCRSGRLPHLRHRHGAEQVLPDP